MNLITSREVDNLYKKVGVNPDTQYVRSTLNTGSLNNRLVVGSAINKSHYGNQILISKNNYSFK